MKTRKKKWAKRVAVVLALALVGGIVYNNVNN